MSHTGRVPPALLGRSVGGLGGHKLRFRPQLFWQEVLPEQACTNDLQFHFDMETGRNFARLPTDVAEPPPPDGAFAHKQARSVPDWEADSGEAAFVGRALRELSAIHGDVSHLRHCLSSCFCTVGSLQPALCEAARHDNTDAVTLLLRANAEPSAQPVHIGKSALHVACESGSESAARLLIAADPAGITLMSLVNGVTAIEMARANDLSSMARRLEAYAKELGAIGGSAGGGGDAMSAAVPVGAARGPLHQVGSYTAWDLAADVV